MNSRLDIFSKQLLKTISLVEPSISQAIVDKRKSALKLAFNNLEKDRSAAFMQRAIAQKKKHILEEEAEREEKIRREKAQLAQIAESKRLEAEAKKREHERMVAQRKEIEKQEAQVSSINV